MFGFWKRRQCCGASRFNSRIGNFVINLFRRFIFRKRIIDAYFNVHIQENGRESLPCIDLNIALLIRKVRDNPKLGVHGRLVSESCLNCLEWITYSQWSLKYWKYEQNESFATKLFSRSFHQFYDFESLLALEAEDADISMLIAYHW